ncbi:MAG: UPF0149 family protein [Polaromonas sp.]|uniref:UPF0149 family protein n=1 Tax=Polaromonas sp. TaxID=1869339 RepID=UPI002489DA18|nr:UPF0149 family protein [Polaromonas sp.]MDI1268840.1 UPF0149 family protein [Polaromonas sp.]
MTDDIEIIHSPLAQTYSAGGHTLRIEIYRSADSLWILEVVDEGGTSTVWDDPFKTDRAALEAAFLAIETEGAHSFLTDAGKPRQEVPANGNELFEPLTEEELDELEHFLLYELDTEEGMTLDILDGFLHAIVIGPVFIHPHEWLPKVWGTEDDETPPMPSVEVFNRVLQLIMRHYNGIVSGFSMQPPEFLPLWATHTFEEQEFDDAEGWAYGFCEGVKLSQPAWQALLDDSEGERWYRPIGLLGGDDYSADQMELTTTPAQRHVLAAAIGNNLPYIHAFWLPMREAVNERQRAQRMSNKVGRNEPCPCGSGKKFKKCCGAPSQLH